MSGDRDGAAGFRPQPLRRFDSVLAPPAIHGIDVLVADLQDVGSRYYTFAATIDSAREIAPAGRVVVLDRPNDRRTRVEPGLDPAMRSFVGHIEVLIRTGSRWASCRRRAAAGCRRAEIVLRDWRRSMDFEETDFCGSALAEHAVDTPSFIPAMPRRGDEPSEGGTDRPFEDLAPLARRRALARRLSRRSASRGRLPAHRLRPAVSEVGERCGGVAPRHESEDLPARADGVASLPRRGARAARLLAPGPYEFVSIAPRSIPHRRPTVREDQAGARAALTTGWTSRARRGGRGLSRHLRGTCAPGTPNLRFQRETGGDGRRAEVSFAPARLRPTLAEG